MSDLHYTSYGNGAPLVLVHGLAGSTRWWRRNTRALSNHFKVYLVDLPGFGLSGQACALEDVTLSLPAWLDWMGLERVYLVGHSMGGYVSLRMAALQPERVEKLALIDSVGIPTKGGVQHMMLRLMRAMKHGSFSFIPTVVSDGLRAGIPTLLRLTNEICQVDARPYLPRIQAPTMVLWGTRDVMLPPQMGLQMAEMIPNASFKFIPRAGHNAMADRPNLVNEYLLDFLREEPKRLSAPPMPLALGEIKTRVVADHL
ncbi:MAG: alpha/beta fold hydrolase [Ardenticatenales bacterium]|nr:alpha/beta fold hydrolase [Ardenticatenales bacterium]